jgi:hypothetical protein
MNDNRSPIGTNENDMFGVKALSESISIKNCRYVFNPIIPPLEKGGEGGFKIREIPLNPPLPKGEVNPVVALNSALGFTPLEIMPRSVSSRNDWNF